MYQKFPLGVWCVQYVHLMASEKQLSDVVKKVWSHIGYHLGAVKLLYNTNLLQMPVLQDFSTLQILLTLENVVSFYESSSLFSVNAKVQSVNIEWLFSHIFQFVFNALSIFQREWIFFVSAAKSGILKYLERQTTTELSLCLALFALIWYKSQPPLTLVLLTYTFVHFIDPATKKLLQTFRLYEGFAF